MAKEFSKKYMHPTRRKLVDMVHTGEYEKDLSVGYREKKEHIIRKVGDKWEDERFVYEQKDGYVTKSGKNSEVFTNIRKWLKEKEECKCGKDCKTKFKSQKDKKLIVKTGYCINCLAEIETEIRLAGLWEDYQNYRIWSKMIIEGKNKLEQVRQAVSELKQEYEYVNSDGSADKWVMEQPIEEVRNGMLEFIKNGEKEVQDLIEKRDLAFERIKEKNYEHTL